MNTCIFPLTELQAHRVRGIFNLENRLRGEGGILHWSCSHGTSAATEALTLRGLTHKVSWPEASAIGFEALTTKF